MKQRSRNEDGFTLVELIVVIVILALLAAILVPTLLGYIDTAKGSKYFDEGRNIKTSLQSVIAEDYSKGFPTYTRLKPKAGVSGTQGKILQGDVLALYNDNHSRFIQDAAALGDFSPDCVRTVVVDRSTGTVLGLIFVEDGFKIEQKWKTGEWVVSEDDGKKEPSS